MEDRDRFLDPTLSNGWQIHNEWQTCNDWQPSADIHTLKARAHLYADIRAFFAMRDVLEVETPLLCAAGVTDLHIQNIPALYSESITSTPSTLYLQTSPEFAMKRLLAAGTGSLYQLCKAFRNGERGRFHNPEFTILEWYRIAWDHHQLMDEMDTFLNFTLGTAPSKRYSYRALFKQHCNLDPHLASIETLKAVAQHYNIQVNNIQVSSDLQGSARDSDPFTSDDWLDLLMTHVIEPTLKGPTPFFIYDYPASQAALAKVRPAIGEDPAVAERFEVYINGIELANGYHELIDADIQWKRFQHDNAARQTQGLKRMAPDIRLMKALKKGLPSCAGVAVGVDRLLMVKQELKTIDEVLTFPIESA